MKNLRCISLCFSILFSVAASAQNVSINENGTAPDARAILDVSSINHDKGVLIPRLSAAEIALMTGIPTGLLVFNSTADDFFFYNGSTWKKVGLGKTGGPFDDSTYFKNITDTTKQFRFSLAGIRTGTKRIYDVPDTSTTLAGTTAVQSLTNKTITDATNLVRATQLATSATGTDVSITGAAPPVAGQHLTATAANAAGWENSKIWVIKDIRSTGTPGGSATSGSWYTRILNTMVSGGGPEVTLQSLTTILVSTAGIYRIKASAPAYNCGTFQTRLFNATTGTAVGYGTSGYIGAAVQGTSEIDVVVTVNTPTQFVIQEQVGITQLTNGFGVASSYTGNQEVYTSVTVEKL